MRSPILIRSLPAFAGVLAMVGCRSAPEQDPSLFGPARAVEGAITVAQAHPILAGEVAGTQGDRRFNVLRGEGAGRVRVVEARARGDHTMLLRRSLEGDQGPESVQRFSIDADGSLVSARSTNHDREVITEFNPPMLIFPARLEPAMASTQSLEFVVRPIDRPQKVKQRGDATITVEIVGLESVSFPEGLVDAVHVRTTLEIDFGAARVERTTDQWLLLDVGVIAEAYDETVKVLGVQTERRAATMRAARMPAMEPE